MSTLAPLFLAKHPDGEERQVIRPNVWETSCADTETLSIFHIEGMADPDLLCRVLNLFAVQSFTPERVRADREDHKIRLLLTFPGLSQHRASVIAEKLRSLVTVLAVRLEFSPPCRQGPSQRQRAAAGQRRLSPSGRRGGRPVHSASSAGLLALAGRPAHGYSAGSPGSQKTAMCSPDPAERAHVPTAFPSG
ncbi:hypothetical protein [Pseudomonas aeruginosa]|uniref:hypothetical protein n=1 Tax=Pseudomonas aeruginosa TaxID=287 RepID=UPI0037489A6F